MPSSLLKAQKSATAGNQSSGIPGAALGITPGTISPAAGRSPGIQRILDIYVPAGQTYYFVCQPGQEIVTPTKIYYEFSMLVPLTVDFHCIIARLSDLELVIPPQIQALWRERYGGKLGFTHGEMAPILTDPMPDISTFSMSELEQAQDIVDGLQKAPS